MNRLVKKIIITASLFCAALFSTSSEATTLHAIFIGDTLGENIERSVAKDIQHMDSEVALIAQYTGVDTEKTVVLGDEITDSILDQIRAIEIEDDDIVLFYYSGHGYRQESKLTVWPNFDVTTLDCGIDFEKVQNILQQKNPRLLIAIADCCNSIFPDYWAAPLMQSRASKRVIRNNYKRLFLEQRGEILVASSDVDQVSWCNDWQGGFFTYNFLVELHKAASSEEEYDWEFIIESVRAKLSDDEQTPISQITLNQ